MMSTPRVSAIAETVSKALGRKVALGVSVTLGLGSGSEAGSGDGGDGEASEEARDGVRQEAAAAVLKVLKEAPDSFRTQWAGVSGLSELCRERATAAYINAQNGQELLLFNPFRELLEDELTQAPIRTLRHTADSDSP